MGKTKSSVPKEANIAGKDVHHKSLSSVKEGGIVKASASPKAKSKDLAKQAAKAHEADKVKAKQPLPAESSEEDDDSDDESDDDSDGASSTESDAESSDAEDTKKAAATNGVKVNGASKKANHGDKETSESSESSDGSADSESDSESESEGKVEKKSKAEAKKQNGVVSKDSKIPVAKIDDESEDEDSESSDESEEETTKAAPDSGAKNGSTKAGPKDASSDDDSGSDESSDSSDSESDSASSSEEEVEKEASPKKRKVENDEAPVSKKVKTEVPAVDDAEKRNLFIGRLSFNVDDEWLTREFEEFGQLARVQVMLDRESGRSRGFAYVEFNDAADGERAQSAMNGREIDGRPVNVDFSRPKPQGQPREERANKYGDRVVSPPSTTIFVANISFNATSEAIGAEFSQHGDVVGVRLPTDRETGEMKGFGYVEFSSIEEAQKAFNSLNGKPLLGRVPRLDYSQPRDNNGDSSGFSRGGGRGGFRGGARGRGGFDRGGRGGFDRGGRGGGRGGRGGSTNRGGFGDFKGKKMNLS